MKSKKCFQLEQWKKRKIGLNDFIIERLILISLKKWEDPYIKRFKSGKNKNVFSIQILNMNRGHILFLYQLKNKLIAVVIMTKHNTMLNKL